MSELSFSHEVCFSTALQGDSNLHKSLLLREFFKHAIENGIQTLPELPETADEFVSAVLDKPLEEVLFRTTLFVGEKARLEKQGFIIKASIPAAAPA